MLIMDIAGIKLRLIEDWQRIMKRAWSVRFWALAIVCQFFEITLPLIQGAIYVPPSVGVALSIAAGIFATAGMVARFMVQRGVQS